MQESPPRAAETNSYGQERSSRTAVTNSLRRKGQIYNQSNIKNPKFEAVKYFLKKVAVPTFFNKKKTSGLLLNRKNCPDMFRPCTEGQNQ